jgi:hypothetical protein
LNQSRQDEKYFLNMAGEFLVAGELFRQHLHASVTYGNAKGADVVAWIRRSSPIIIEVKTTGNDCWVVGNRAPEPSDDIWILVPLHRGNDGLESGQGFRIEAQLNASRDTRLSADEALPFEV